MWFMNKIANPFVRLILRSPLHRMMSAALLLITYRGRKSGKEYTLPVQYAQEGRTIYIVPGMPEQKTWWRSLRGGAPVRLRLAGKNLSAQAEVLEGPAAAEAILPALAVYLKRFPGTAKMYRVRLGADGAPDPDDLRRAAAEGVVVKAQLS